MDLLHTMATSAHYVFTGYSLFQQALPDQRSAWFTGCLSVCIVWIAVLLCPPSFGRRVAVLVHEGLDLGCCLPLPRQDGGRSLLGLLTWFSWFPCLLSVALQGLLALRAAKELLRMKPKGAACCVLVWAYSDEALGWAACWGSAELLAIGFET